MLIFYKFLFCQSVFLLSISLNIIKQISGEIIQVDLHSGESYTNTLNNSQIIVINYHLRNKATLASNYELSPIVYRSHLNLQSKSKEGIQTELSRILPLLIYTRDDWTGLTAQLPFFFLGNNFIHVFTERGGTICPKNLQMDVVNTSIINETILPKVSLTTFMTSSPYQINFTFKAGVQEITTLNLNSTLTKSILPFEPLILRFKFYNDTSTTIKMSVTSNDSQCMIIAAEFTHCPTFTTFDSKIEFGPLTQRMQNQGVLVMEKSYYQEGELFIVFEVQPSYDICDDKGTYSASDPWGTGNPKTMIYHTPEEDHNLIKTINISFQSVSITSSDWLINGFISLFVPIFVTIILVITPICCLYQCYKPSHEETAKLRNDSSIVSKTNVNIYEYRSSYLFAFNNSINIFWALAIQTSWYLLPV